MSERGYKHGFGMTPRVIPNGGVATLTPSEKAVYLVLAQHSSPERGCDPSYERIVSEAGVSDSSAKRAIKSLEKEGKIKVERGGGRCRCNRYWLLEGKGVTSDTVSSTETVSGGTLKQCQPTPERVSIKAVNSVTGDTPTYRTERTDNNRGDAVVEMLTRRGVELKAAEALATEYAADRIEEVCIASDRKRRDNSGGWIRGALEDEWPLGDEVKEEQKKAREAEERDRAAEQFKAMAPAEREPIIESIRVRFPGIALKIKPGMNSNELMDLPGFPGAVRQALCRMDREELKGLCLT